MHQQTTGQLSNWNDGIAYDFDRGAILPLHDPQPPLASVLSAVLRLAQSCR